MAFSKRRGSARQNGETDKVVLDASRTVSSLYWRQLGRPATDAELADGVTRLSSEGVSETARFLSQTPEAVRRAHGMCRALRFESGEWVLPYSFEPTALRVPVASLVVRIHGVTFGECPPPDLVVSTPQANRLAIGSGPHPPHSTEALLQWSKTAAKLVREVCRAHEVPPENVLFVGHSWAATLAAMCVCRLGSGAAILGAPAVSIGTWTARVQQLGVRRGPLTPLFESVYNAAEIHGAEERVRALDTVLTDLLTECGGVSWIIGASRTDSFWTDAERMLLALPLEASTQLELMDYLEHDDLEAVFDEFAARHVDGWFALKYQATAKDE
jgi:hypothetical protein